MVEIANGKEFKPTGGAGLGTMDDLKRCGEMAAKIARGLIEHVSSVSDCIVPEFSPHLFSVKYSLAIAIIVLQVHSTRPLED